MHVFIANGLSIYMCLNPDHPHPDLLAATATLTLLWDIKSQPLSVENVDTVLTNDHWMAANSTCSTPSSLLNSTSVV